MASIPIPTNPAAGAATHETSGTDSLSDILTYISSSWDTLTRSMNRCESLEDTKTQGPPLLYLPAEMSVPSTLSASQTQCHVRVENLPTRITRPGEIDLKTIPLPGLLYLENPYVVPGGQFNEMYGWDSYFIIRGLIRDHRLDLAKGMVENFLFEIDHYGSVLNANRTYYLNRSQPPFLTSMILAIYDAETAAGKNSLPWLARAYLFAVRDHEQWTAPPHLAGDTGLSRYFDRGEGPVPEIMGDPSHYYRGVSYYFLVHGGSYEVYLDHARNEKSSNTVGPRFPVFVCDPETGGSASPGCTASGEMSLTAEFYKGDRSMRESGFDVTFRFGPFGADTHHYAPVCLNSLLYKTEKDLERISILLSHREQATKWAAQAADRKARMLKYFWNDKQGLFFDYDFVTHAQSTYQYATTFYPLWAGLASQTQAAAVARNLPLFELAGGLAMSRFESQAQWDYPYGWAPIHLLAVEGLRKYGYATDADRISGKFLSTVLDNFRREHNIREKYNMVTLSSETAIAAGYAQNVTGFGWTNAVFLELLNESPAVQVSLERRDNGSK
jgi:alpha,alpha-trehalase